MGSRRAALNTVNPLRRPGGSFADLTALMEQGEPGSALTVRPDGTYQVGPFVLTATGLTTDAAITEQDWQELGGLLSRIKSSFLWWVGDWIISADTEWGEMYDRAMQITGLSYQALNDAVWVCRQIDFSSRNENLSFSHHRAVAGLEKAQRVYWLGYAAENGLSVAKLRKAIQGQPPPASSDSWVKPAVKRAFNRVWAGLRKANPEVDAAALDKLIAWATELRDAMQGDISARS